MITREFLAQYVRSAIHLVSITPDGSVTGRWFGNDVDAAVQWAASENLFGKNLYWTTNQTTDGLHKKPSKADITAARFAHVDVDPPKDAVSWDKQAALADIIARGRPSFVIDSGNGLQSLWRLDTPVTDQNYIETINRGLEAAFAGDHCFNVDRLLRVPGTTNYPDAKKRAAGRVPTQSTIIVPETGAVYAAPYIAQYFPAPAREEIAAVEMTDAPVPEWCGPTDDDELIRRMTAAKGSIGAIFGDKATPKDLWTANVAVLSKAFPPLTGTHPFDHSAADAALMAHLAFWTGKNAARMDRLFRRSALMREKYATRPEYGTETIRKSIGGCRSVYNVPQKDKAQPPQPIIQLPGVDAAVNTTDELLTPQEQITYFKGCTYVLTEHKILIPNGELIKPDQFRALYGGHLFIISPGEGQPTKSAYEAFTENRAVKFPRVTKTVFNPKKEFGHIENDTVNTFFPDPNVRAVKGDVTIMLRHFEKLFPDERDREIVWSWLAAQTQYVGEKFQWAMFFQGAQGNGKSVIGNFMKYVVGERYYHKPMAADVDNKFNDFMDMKLFIDVQEITLENKYEVYENLKEWITADYIEMQPKGGKKAMRANLANWMIVSNHQSALPFDRNERRIAPFFTPQQSAEDVIRDGMGGTYFPDMWSWLKHDDGYAKLTYYLQNRDIYSEFNPIGGAAARAPRTTSTPRAEAASMGRLEQEIVEAVQSETRGFRNGWISSIPYMNLLKEKHMRVAPQKTKATLDKLGYREIGRASRIIMEEDGKRPVLYIERSKWKDGLTVDDYCFAQGYQTTAPNIRGLVA